MSEPLELHQLTSSSPYLHELLPEILELSNTIFSADPGSKYASPAVWHERLAAAPSSTIVYLSPASNPNRPAAFLFAHPRLHAKPLNTGEFESLHVWLAGVAPERRKEGCLARMVQALWAVPVLTVCTSPERYPDMWKWLTGRGWHVERDLGGGKILLSHHAQDATLQ